MTSPLRPPSYGAVVSNPANTLHARPANQPPQPYRPVREVVLRAQGIRSQARTSAADIQVPRAMAPQATSAQAPSPPAYEDLGPPAYAVTPIEGIDHATLSMGPGHRRPAPVELATYNRAIAQVSAELNATMGPVQRRLGRAIAIAGSLASVGGAVTLGVLGVTALASVASGIGLPVGAVAAIGGVAVLIAGSAITLLLGVTARAFVRVPLEDHPQLGEKLDVLRALRDDLLDKEKRSKSEQDLLRNINQVLSKVDGLGAHFKAQLRVMQKTHAAAFGGLFFAGIYAMGAVAPHDAPIAGGKRAVERWFSKHGKPLRNRTNGTVSLPDAARRLHRLRQVVSS